MLGIKLHAVVSYSLFYTHVQVVISYWLKEVNKDIINIDNNLNNSAKLVSFGETYLIHVGGGNSS